MSDYNWFGNKLYPLVSRIGISDLAHNVTGQEWIVDVAQLDAAPFGSYGGTRHRVQFMFTVLTPYCIVAPGVASEDPTDWRAGYYGTSYGSKEGKWSIGWSLLGPDLTDVYHFNGIKMLVRDTATPYLANRYSDTDGQGLNVTLATGPGSTGGTTSLSIAPATFDHNLGYILIVRPNTPQEESRNWSPAPLFGDNEIRWTTPLVNGPIVAGTPFLCRAQRQVVDQRPVGHFTGPGTIGYRMLKVGMVTNPTGELWRDGWTGYWMPSLPGNYSVWRVSNSINGSPFRDMADLYLSTPNAEDNATTTAGFTLAMEFHHFQADNPNGVNTLANQPSDIRYSGTRLRDQNGRWHEVTDWRIQEQWFTFAGSWTANVDTPSGTFNTSEKITWQAGAGHGLMMKGVTGTPVTFLHTSGPAPIIGDVLDGDVTNAQRTITSWVAGTPPASDVFDNPTTDMTWGWDVTVPGKLRHQAGLAVGEKTLDQYFLTGLTYEGDRGTLLPSIGLTSVGGGNATYVGYMFRKPNTSYPFVLQEINRGYYVVHPNTTEAANLVYIAQYTAIYTFAGDFARATPGAIYVGEGDGVACSVYGPTGLLFSSIVSSSATAPDADNPFIAAGGNQHFSVTTPMSAGQKVYFRVAGRGYVSYDTTAFQLTEASYVPVPDFTGWGGHRGTAGHDRAVRCPRCGMVLREADLVVDGVTRTSVCTECYDPPPQPPNWRWPFRT